ncbi:uncharacterized protein V1518DRAFT_416346, partial [Limtongia smithiae]|uniref:uncharacterized protein n=1 Tax=Limtongia smithiae TaxID=1125753 RepID=UPI0034CE8C26
MCRAGPWHPSDPASDPGAGLRWHARCEAVGSAEKPRDTRCECRGLSCADLAARRLFLVISLGRVDRFCSRVRATEYRTPADTQKPRDAESAGPEKPASSRSSSPTRYPKTRTQRRERRMAWEEPGRRGRSVLPETAAVRLCLENAATPHIGPPFCQAQQPATRHSSRMHAHSSRQRQTDEGAKETQDVPRRVRPGSLGSNQHRGTATRNGRRCRGGEG